MPTPAAKERKRISAIETHQYIIYVLFQVFTFFHTTRTHAHTHTHTHTSYVYTEAALRRLSGIESILRCEYKELCEQPRPTWSNIRHTVQELQLSTTSLPRFPMARTMVIMVRRQKYEKRVYLIKIKSLHRNHICCLNLATHHTRAVS